MNPGCTNQYMQAGNPFGDFLLFLSFSVNRIPKGRVPDAPLSSGPFPIKEKFN
jgi:hypothetical protein